MTYCLFATHVGLCYDVTDTGSKRQYSSSHDRVSATFKCRVLINRAKSRVRKQFKKIIQKVCVYSLFSNVINGIRGVSNSAVPLKHQHYSPDVMPGRKLHITFMDSRSRHIQGSKERCLLGHKHTICTFSG